VVLAGASGKQRLSGRIRSPGGSRYYHTHIYGRERQGGRGKGGEGGQGGRERVRGREGGEGEREGKGGE
jgi:hypothetical protein